MTRALMLPLVAMGAVLAGAQQPVIQNGRVETRQTSSIASAVEAVGANAQGPIWVGWRVPIAPGMHAGCCWYDTTGEPASVVRGCLVESSPGGQVPQISQPTGPVPLEAGTGLVVLARIVDRQVERLRTLGDDCPLDAGGRTVYWLAGVTTAESLAYLGGLVGRESLTSAAERRTTSAAIGAIALHAGSAADALLDRLAADPDASTRQQAGMWLATARGAHGQESLQRLLASESSSTVRRQFVVALGQTHQPGTAGALLALARSDADPKVRGEAIYWYGVAAGAAGADNVLGVIDHDPDSSVKQRAVASLGHLPNNQGVPMLIQLARAKTDLAVRKEAVVQLGRSKDPRAVAFLEEILK
jgi:HEAT repeats